MVKINGKNADVAGKTVEEYIESAGYQKSRIVVELNQAVLPKAEYECIYRVSRLSEIPYSS